MSWLLGLGWLVLAALASAGPATAQELLLRYSVLAEDDPQAALERAGKELQATSDAQQRFWLLLSQGRALFLLEDQQAARLKVAEAGTLLERMPEATPAMRDWLGLEMLGASLWHEAPEQINARLLTLRQSLRGNTDAKLACELLAMEMWILADNRSLDEAWIAAEEVERCSATAGLPYLLPHALATRGRIAREVPTEQRRGRNAIELYTKALEALGPEGLRFRRSIFEWYLAQAHQDDKQWASALAHLRTALALSKSLRDRAGVGAAHLELARVHLHRDDPRSALNDLQEAHEQLNQHDSGARMVPVYSLKLQAMTQLRRPDVLGTINRARRWDTEAVQPVLRATLARAMGEAYASQTRWREAYAEARRASEFDTKARALASDSQVLRLQARYDNVQREAETAELKHREETARLALQAEGARQRSLWAALLLLLVLLTGAAGWLMVQAQRRSTFAALALKDELTGAPNRRAVAAYAQAQFKQMRRLGLPMTVAVVDLDHFKRVNDNYGHATGDEVLRAFAKAAASVLRGQDRIGRWGGEEWLLVMPGTRQEELPRVFERLRRAFAAVSVAGMPAPHACTFSMGAAQAGEGLDSLDALVAEADARLYGAKQGGRDRLALAA
jgi:diguanylate cyclase (GGDEF)-like protein